jgi:hypothetical protein
VSGPLLRLSVTARTPREPGLPPTRPVNEVRGAAARADCDYRHRRRACSARALVAGLIRRNASLELLEPAAGTAPG